MLFLQHFIGQCIVIHRYIVIHLCSIDTHIKTASICIAIPMHHSIIPSLTYIHIYVYILTCLIGPSKDAPTLVDNTTSAEVRISLMAFYCETLITVSYYVHIRTPHMHYCTHIYTHTLYVQHKYYSISYHTTGYFISEFSETMT